MRATPLLLPIPNSPSVPWSGVLYLPSGSTSRGGEWLVHGHFSLLLLLFTFPPCLILGIPQAAVPSGASLPPARVFHGLQCGHLLQHGVHASPVLMLPRLFLTFCSLLLSLPNILSSFFPWCPARVRPHHQPEHQNLVHKLAVVVKYLQDCYKIYRVGPEMPVKTAKSKFRSGHLAIYLRYMCLS